MSASEIANYEEQVYAGVLGKVVGVYMGAVAEKIWLCPQCKTFMPRA